MSQSPGQRRGKPVYLTFLPRLQLRGQVVLAVQAVHVDCLQVPCYPVEKYPSGWVHSLILCFETTVSIETHIS